jgi:AAA domain
MRTLTHVLAGEEAGGKALPDLHPMLTKKGIKLRRNSVTMLCAQPNGGKSAFALHYAIKSGLRVLYISADTDQLTTMLRTSAIVLDQEVSEIEKLVEAGDRAVIADAVGGDLEERLRFCFDPSPSLDDIALEVEAYLELFGDYPHLMIVDNASNLVSGNENEWSALREVCVAMHHMCRATGACILLLHHVSEGSSKSNLPAARSAIMGKVSALPEQILSVAIDPDNDEFRVAAVKNRHGKHDSSGKDWVPIPIDLSRMRFYDSVADLQLAQKRSEWQ